jgi:nuclear control of ATPase protein 2
MLGILRNIDRILTTAQPTQHGDLYYKSYGQLLCEVHVLRQVAIATIPEEELREFVKDLEELTDIRNGVARQRDVAKRIRWGYARWL